MKNTDSMNVNKPTTEKKLIDLNNDIIHNFDVSIVMSFYKRYTEFKKYYHIMHPIYNETVLR